VLTTLPPSCADCLEIWEPQPPGSLRACRGPYRDCFTLTLRNPTFSHRVYLYISYDTKNEGQFLPPKLVFVRHGVYGGTYSVFRRVRKIAKSDY
jgi:hypothetical protein